MAAGALTMGEVVRCDIVARHAAAGFAEVYDVDARRFRDKATQRAFREWRGGEEAARIRAAMERADAERARCFEEALAKAEAARAAAKEGSADRAGAGMEAAAPRVTAEEYVLAKLREEGLIS